MSHKPVNLTNNFVDVFLNDVYSQVIKTSRIQSFVGVQERALLFVSW